MQEQVFDAADTATGILQILPAFTRSLKFRFDRMKTAATTGYLNAMAAATYLSNKGVPFRKAHEIVGNAVRLGLESGRELNDLKLEGVVLTVGRVCRGLFRGPLHHAGGDTGLSQMSSEVLPVTRGRGSFRTGCGEE